MLYDQQSNVKYSTSDKVVIVLDKDYSTLDRCEQNQYRESKLFMR